MDSIGAAIKQLRKALGGLSQERFAHRLGLTTRTISRWEHGDPLPPHALSRLRSIAIGLKDRETADFFEKQLREDLDWEVIDPPIEGLPLPPPGR